MKIDFLASQSETEGMTEFPSGHLVFAVANTLSSVHNLASQIGRLKSDAHLFDVGLLAKDAWVAAWVRETSDAEKVAKLIGGKSVVLSSEAAKALMSLGAGLGANHRSIGLLETTGTENLAEFFHGVAECEKAGWIAMEIRVRKSGPSGAHAFFAKSESATMPAVNGFTELPVEGEYRKFF